MSEADRHQWFKKTYGRAPRDRSELEAGMFQAQWASDPQACAAADRVVAYAEARGGKVLAFAKLHWAHYWGLAMPLSLSAVMHELGISEDEASQLLVQIAQATAGPGVKDAARSEG